MAKNVYHPSKSKSLLPAHDYNLGLHRFEYCCLSSECVSKAVTSRGLFLNTFSARYHGYIHQRLSFSVYRPYSTMQNIKLADHSVTLPCAQYPKNSRVQLPHSLMKSQLNATCELRTKPQPIPVRCFDCAALYA